MHGIIFSCGMVSKHDLILSNFNLISKLSTGLIIVPFKPEPKVILIELSSSKKQFTTVMLVPVYSLASVANNISTYIF